MVDIEESRTHIFEERNRAIVHQMQFFEENNAMNEDHSNRKLNLSNELLFFIFIK